MAACKRSTSTLKRKASQASRKPAARRSKRLAETPTHKTKIPLAKAQAASKPKTKVKPFRFLALPAELRNAVYGHLAEDQVAYLHSRKLMYCSGLLSANRQLRHEYLSLTPPYAKTIQANVKNFDFGEVVGLLNRFSAAELAALSRIRIRLYCTTRTSETTPLLERWLWRRGDAGKKGSRVEVEYFAPQNGDISKRMWKAKYGNDMYYARMEVGVLNRFIHRFRGRSSLAKEEAEKIRDAIVAMLDSED